VIVASGESYAVSPRRRKMIEYAFGWIREIGKLHRLMAHGLETIRAQALSKFATDNRT
jgi:hypothetical protein